MDTKINKSKSVEFFFANIKLSKKDTKQFPSQWPQNEFNQGDESSVHWKL
jgi:hypothetical protein